MLLIAASTDERSGTAAGELRWLFNQFQSFLPFLTRSTPFPPTRLTILHCRVYSAYRFLEASSDDCEQKLKAGARIGH